MFQARAASTLPEPAGDLAQLVSAEQRLEERLADARRDAAAILTETAAECEALVRGYEAEAAASRGALQTSIEQARQEQTARLITAGSERAARCDSIPESKILQLSDLVLARLLDGGAS